MSASHFGSGFWPDDYFGLYFQPEAGGVVIGTLAGSAAGVATVTGALQQPAGASVAGSVAGVTPEEVARIRRFLKREKAPVTKLYKHLVRLKRHVPEPAKQEIIKLGEQHAKPDVKPLSFDWLNFESIMKAGDQERMATLLNNAIMAAEIAKAEDEDDEDILLLLYG